MSTKFDVLRARFDRLSTQRDRLLDRIALQRSSGDIAELAIDKAMPLSATVGEITPVLPALPLVGQRQAVVLVLPTVRSDIVYGGIATAFLFGVAIAERAGLPLRIVTISASCTEADVLRLAAAQGVDHRTIELYDCFRDGRHVPMHPKDIVIATAWWTAHAAQALTAGDRRFVYLVQDYEPIFYPNSTQSALAEASYRFPHAVHVYNSSVLRDFFATRRYPCDFATFFEPAIPRQIFARRQRPTPLNATKRLFFYARPSVSRNLYDLGVEALRLAFTSGEIDLNRVELLIAGDVGLKPLNIGGVIAEPLPKLDYRSYGELLTTVDLGISLMLAPHPSYPPLELATCGNAVVSTRWETKIDLDRYTDAVSLVEATPIALMEAIIDRYNTIGTEHRDCSLPSTWDEALAEPVEQCYGELRK
jgi:O-antigen biosynthesis protein